MLKINSLAEVEVEHLLVAVEYIVEAGVALTKLSIVTEFALEETSLGATAALPAAK